MEGDSGHYLWFQYLTALLFYLGGLGNDNHLWQRGSQVLGRNGSRFCFTKQLITSLCKTPLYYTGDMIL